MNMAEGIRDIMSDQITDPATPMRSELDREGLFELAANIKQNGLINPITVRPAGDYYEVVAGHRRFAACKIAGIIRIACVVRELTDEQAFSVMTAENLEREDVSLLDECRHYLLAQQRFGKTVSEIAKAARRSEAYIRARLAIAEMPEYLQVYLQTKEISLGVALVLNEITNEGIRHTWVEQAVRDGISVAQAEYWLHGWKVNQLPGGTPPASPPEGGDDSQPRVSLIECAVDGKKYDARLFKAVLVYEGNYELFLRVAEELRRELSEVAPPARAIASAPPSADGGD